MSYQIPTPLPFSILGLLFRTVPLASGNPQSKYSVIIPLYNKRKTIVKCLESVLRQTKKPFQIIVIDDHSTDNSLKALEKFRDRIVLIKNEKNLGKAKSINKALKKVESPFVLILDADTFLEDNFVHLALQGFYDKKIKGVCGTVLPDKVSSPYEYSRLIEYLYSQRLYKIIQSRIHGIWVLCGCATIWRTSFLKENEYPSSSVVEDLEATWLAQEKYLLNFNPKAVCYTSEPESLRKYLQQIRRWFSWRKVVTDRLRKVRLGLKATFFWLMGEAIGFILWFIFFLWNILMSNWLGALFLFLTDFLIIFSLSICEGKKFKIPLTKVLKGIPFFYSLRFLNIIMFWKSFISPKRKWEKDEQNERRK